MNIKIRIKAFIAKILQKIWFNMNIYYKATIRVTESMIQFQNKKTIKWNKLLDGNNVIML
jgi:hypothetical protein